MTVPSGAITIRDIARQAGVSVATVSRTLNAEPTVDPELASRVRAAVAASGYVRNAAGRALRRQVADVWAAIVPDLNPFYTGVVAEFENCAIENGYSVMLCNTNEDLARERRYVTTAASQLIAGAIMVVASERRSDLAPMLEVKMPVVLFDREVRDYAGDSVVVDNELAGRLVAEHLLERGFERPACIAGPADVTTTEGRLRGFAATLSAAGRPLAQAHVVRSPLNSSGAGRAVRSLLALDRPPDVVFATTGPLAAGAFQALQEEGLSADGPLALVGHDDDQWMRIVHPAITTVRQPIEEIGRVAGEMLLRRERGSDRPGSRRVLSPELVIRASTGRPR